MNRDRYPAFPGPWRNESDVVVCAPDGQAVPPGAEVYMPGMTLRDWFAAKALQGLLACQRPDFSTSAAKNVTAAYQFADLMLDERGPK